MRTTIDKAGRIVIPRELRERIGLIPGPVDVHAVGNAIQIEIPEHEVDLELLDGLLTLPQDDQKLGDDEVRELRFDAQR